MMTISTIINLMIIKNRVNDHYNIDVHLHYHFFDDAPNTHNFGHHSFFLLIPQRTMEVALKNDIAVVASTIILLGSAEI